MKPPNVKYSAYYRSRRCPACYMPPSDNGEWSRTLCGSSILDTPVTTKREETGCPVCLCRFAEIDQQAHDMDPILTEEETQ